MITTALLIFIGLLILEVRSLCRSTRHGWGYPFIALGSFTYLYCIQPMLFLYDGSLQLFVSDWQITKGILVAAVVLAAFVVGWVDGSRCRIQSTRCTVPTIGFWDFGFCASTLGIVLYVTFLGRSGGVLKAFGEPHGLAMQWKENTAYLYSGPTLVLSGCLMMMTTAVRRRLWGWRRIIPSALFAGLMLHFLLLGSRGGFFATTATLFVTLAALRGIRCSVARALAIGAVISMVVIAIGAYRSYVYLGADLSKVPPPSVALWEFFTIGSEDREAGVTGAEIVLHAATIDAVDRTQKYGLGISWLYVFTIKPIPRLLWAGKPYGFESPGVASSDITTVAGLSLGTSGPASGFVASVYREFGMLCVPLVYLAASSAGRLFARSRDGNPTTAFCAFVILYAVSLNGFAQGIGAMFETYLMAMSPVLLYSVARSKRKEDCVREVEHCT